MELTNVKERVERKEEENGKVNEVTKKSIVLKLLVQKIL